MKRRRFWVILVIVLRLISKGRGRDEFLHDPLGDGIDAVRRNDISRELIANLGGVCGPGGFDGSKFGLGRVVRGS